MENNLDIIINKKLKADWSFEQRLIDTSGYNKRLFSHFLNIILSYNYPKGAKDNSNLPKGVVEANLNEKVGVYYLGSNKIAEFELTDDDVLCINVPVVYTVRNNKAYLNDKNLMIKFKVYDGYGEKLVSEALVRVAESLKGVLNEQYTEIDFSKQYQNEDESEVEIVEVKKIVENKNTKIYVSNLISEEHRKNDNILEPILHNVSVDVYDGDILGVYGLNDDEVELFMQIFGNMRPFYKGSVKLSEFGVKQHKKELMESLYYIDSTTALYGRMTVLEQLMFACSASRKTKEAPKKQKELLDILVALNLKDIALSKISSLNIGKRMIVQLLVAWLSKSTVIIANLHRYTFKQEEIEAIATVVDFINEKGVTLLISAKQPKFIGMVCTRVLFLVNGQVEFDGGVDELTKNWDRVVCMIRGNNLKEIAIALENEMRHVRCVLEDDTLFVRNHDEKEWNLDQFYSIMKRNGFEPSFIKFNKGRVENSFNELMVKYDL